MLNFFKDLLLREKILFLSVLFLGIFLRLISLSEISSWNDEIATWYFANNINVVFSSESHTPIYYLICRVWIYLTTNTIFSIRVLSIVLSYCTLFLCIQFLKNTSKFLILGVVTFWSLVPTFIVYDRQARHYGFFAELAFLLLIIWDYKSDVRFFLKWFLMTFIQILHPLAFIQVIFLVLLDFARSKISIKEGLYLISSSLPVSVYYLLRFYFQDFKTVTANIAWIRNDFVEFFKSLILMFAGDSYPFTLVFPLSADVAIFSCFVLFLSFFILTGWKPLFLSEKFIRFLLMCIFIIMLVESLAYAGLNLRISRYYIFIVPFLLVSLIDFIKNVQTKSFLLLLVTSFILISYNLFQLKPWRTYEWDDDNVSAFKIDNPSYLNDNDLLICGNKMNVEYYFNKYFGNCSEEAFKRYYLKKNFKVFDISGEQSSVALSLYLSNFGNVRDMKFYGRAFYFRFEGRK